MQSLPYHPAGHKRLGKPRKRWIEVGTGLLERIEVGTVPNP